MVLRGSGTDPKSAQPVDDLLARSDGRWLVLHTRSRQEKAVVKDLHAVRAACYLPEYTAVRYYGRRKVRVTQPLFPGYVFLYGYRDQAFLADRLSRLVGIIDVPDQDLLTQELKCIASALEAGGSLEPCNPFTSGDWVEVGSGPFKGIRGQVEGHRQGSRLILGVGFLGLGAALEIDAALVRRIDQPVAAMC
ncbi:MAG: transcription termination/antitermination NusG family protein [Planctomycetota bacterium]